MANLYDTVQVKGVESSLSISQKMDSWGDALLETRRGNYGGRAYILDVAKKTLVETETQSSKTLSPLDKIKVAIGIVFKKIAAFFNSAIDAKYKLASGNHFGANHKLNESEEAQTLLAKLKPVEKKSITKQGSSEDIRGFLWLFLCPCMLLDAINKRHR